MNFRIYATIYLSGKFPEILRLNDRVPPGISCNCVSEDKEKCIKSCPVQKKSEDAWNASEQSYAGHYKARTRATFIAWWIEQHEGCDDEDKLIGQANELWTGYIKYLIAIRKDRKPFGTNSFKRWCKTIDLPDDPLIRTFVLECRNDDTFPKIAALDLMIDYVSENWGDPDSAVYALERLWIDYKTALPLDCKQISDLKASK